MRKKRNYIIFFIFFILSCSSNLENKTQYKEEKIKGTFLLEINVPNAYYSRMDQIEQTYLIVKYESSNKKFITNYTDGVFILFGDTDIQKYKNELMKKRFVFDTVSLNKFSRIFQDAIIDNAQSKKEKFIKLNGNMFYLKFNAEITYINVGKTKQMIPKLKNYQCCYSNIKKRIPTNIILRIDNLIF